MRGQERCGRRHELPPFAFLLLSVAIPLACVISLFGCLPSQPEVSDRANEAESTEPNLIEWLMTEVNAVQADIETHESIEEPVVAEPNRAEPTVPEPNLAGPNEPQEPVSVDFHQKCAPILKRFVREDGTVDYRSLKQDWLELKKVLDEFARLDPNEFNRWPKEDRIAFWINAYNIHLLRIIANNYPIESYRLLHVWPGWGPESIQHINKRIGGIKQQKLTIKNEEFTLDRIENEIFRRDFNEPLVFMAISQATLSGPPLRTEPYTGWKLSEQLNDQARKFLANPKAFKIDREKQAVLVSPLLHPSNYGGEFVKNYGTDKRFKDQTPTMQAVLNFISNYVDANSRSFLENELYTVRFLRYDWQLNDGSGKRQASARAGQTAA